MYFKLANVFIKYIRLTTSILLVILFIFFRLLGVKEMQSIDYNITALLRNEFNSANSYALAKSIIDLEKIGQFECAKLTELNDDIRVFYDSPKTSEKCSSIFNKFSIFKNKSNIESLSGVTYEFSYFYKLNYEKISLEILIYLILVLIYSFFPKYYNNLLQVERTKLIISELQNKNRERVFALSQKLAHDIRSPISTLNLISSKIEDQEIKSLQLAVVDQINSIANDLLNQSKSVTPISNITEITNKENLQFLKKMFQNLEKEYQFKANAISQKIVFEINYAVLENNSVTQKLTSVIYTSVHNFIQNSIDATKADDVIKITVNRNNENRIQICVIDTGKGIPTAILKRLGNEALSYGKSNFDLGAIDDSQTVTSGNGIALFNANKELAENGAKLVINSVENKGTDIKIII